MKKQIMIAFLLLMSIVTSHTIDTGILKDMKPRNIGPGGMSGRVIAIDMVINDPEILYVGIASGGLWKSESGGISF
jgi:hypothetical protein